MIDRQGEQLLEEAMANLLKNGDIWRHLKKSNKIYHERRDTLCKLLNEQLSEYVSFRVPDGGFAVWVKYLNGLDTSIVSKKAAEMGLSVGSGTDYWYANDNNRTFIRLGFASLNPKEIENAVEILDKAVRKAK